MRKFKWVPVFALGAVAGAVAGFVAHLRFKEKVDQIVTTVMERADDLNAVLGKKDHEDG